MSKVLSICPVSRLPPALPPQRLGAEALTRLERQLVAYGKSNVLELVQVCVCWGFVSLGVCCEACVGVSSGVWAAMHACFPARLAASPSPCS